ncbi:MAG TPA: hypothetical protein VLH09_14630 [Bryobacteraceae bacterium]|nr:hypothetical protein [Bryobacteraceae bacterium]
MNRASSIFSRPCGRPEIRTDRKGKAKRIYPWYATPWEMWRRWPGVAGYLEGDLTIGDLERPARVLLKNTG